MLLADALLGDNLLPLLVLALGAAMVVGYGLAMVRPPAPPADRRRKGELTRAPVGRSLLMMGIGLVAGLWALASLLH